MAIPEGYVSLGLVGFTDKGDYSPDAVYVQNDLIHQDNAIWKCLIDGTTGIPPAPGSENWSIYIQSQTQMDGITVADTFGVMGETGEIVVAQSFLDLLAEKVMNQMLTKNGLVNNALATVPGVAALDSVMGATLQEEIDQTNSNLQEIGTVLQSSYVGPNILMTELNHEYDICTITLPKGKWLLIGCTLANGTLTFTYGSLFSGRSTQKNHQSNLAFGLAIVPDGIRSSILRLIVGGESEGYSNSEIHTDSNYCGIKAIKIG